MKPDWKDAPEWAQFVAQDGDGEWWWFEERPRPVAHLGRWMSDFGRNKLAAPGNDPIGPMEPRL